MLQVVVESCDTQRTHTLKHLRRLLTIPQNTLSVTMAPNKVCVTLPGSQRQCSKRSCHFSQFCASCHSSNDVTAVPVQFHETASLIVLCQCWRLVSQRLVLLLSPVRPEPAETVFHTFLVATRSPVTRHDVSPTRPSPTADVNNTTQ